MLALDLLLFGLQPGSTWCGMVFPWVILLGCVRVGMKFRHPPHCETLPLQRMLSGSGPYLPSGLTLSRVSPAKHTHGLCFQTPMVRVPPDHYNSGTVIIFM